MSLPVLPFLQVPQRIKVDIHSADSIFCCLTLASIVLEQQQPQQRQQQQASWCTAPNLTP